MSRKNELNEARVLAAVAAADRPPTVALVWAALPAAGRPSKANVAQICDRLRRHGKLTRCFSREPFTTGPRFGGTMTRVVQAFSLSRPAATDDDAFGR